jgi:hypothetical protein
LTKLGEIYVADLNEAEAGAVHPTAMPVILTKSDEIEA